MTTENPTVTTAAEALTDSAVPKRTIYVLVRRDIPIHQQLVQLGHAAAEAGRKFYKPEHGIASLVALTVPDLAGLYAAQRAMARKSIATETFYEPDFGIGDSAMATEPLLDSQRKYLQAWPLWRLPAHLLEAA